MEVPKAERKSAVRGASLISLLLIVVVLGGLTATAVVGVNSLTGSSDSVGTLGPSGTAAKTKTNRATTVPGGAGGIDAGVTAAAMAACNASMAAANAATSVYYLNSSGTYPTKWSDLTTGNAPLFALPANVAVNAGNPAQLEGRGWTLEMTGGGTAAPTFSCRARPAPAG